MPRSKSVRSRKRRVSLPSVRSRKKPLALPRSVRRKKRPSVLQPRNRLLVRNSRRAIGGKMPLIGKIFTFGRLTPALVIALAWARREAVPVVLTRMTRKPIVVRKKKLLAEQQRRKLVVQQNKKPPAKPRKRKLVVRPKKTPDVQQKQKPPVEPLKSRLVGLLKRKLNDVRSKTRRLLERLRKPVD